MMIAELSVGTATIPDSSPEEPVVVVVTLEPPMSSTNYDVSILRPASIPAEDLDVTDQTLTHVTITVTRPMGNAANPGATIHVICVQRVGQAPIPTPAGGAK